MQATPLTPREVEVLRLLAGGRTARQVAEILDITPRTAEAHAQAIIRKLDVVNITQAVAVAISRGIIAPGLI